VFSNADGRQICTDQGAGAFVVGDEAGEVYVKSADGSLPAGLKEVPMKILEVQSATVAVIAPIDPATGDPTLFTTGSVATDRLTVETRRCLVDEVRVSQAGARVEGVKTTKDSGTPTRIDKNNRIVISGATFVTNLVQVGDFVVWAGFADTEPYSNNGNYRVSQVIDEETIEVVAEDWGPVYLNPDLVPGAGTVTVSTDGSFFTDPFIRFLPEASGGAIPTASDNIQILYLEMTTLRDATDNPSVFNGGGVRYHQEVDDTTQQVLQAILGPSSTSFTEYLHNDARNSLENVDYRLNFEHYPADTVDAGTGDMARMGRHKDIRPDTIDMWDEISGVTFTIRSATGEVDTLKAQVRDPSDNNRLELYSSGKIVLRDSSNDATITLEPDYASFGDVLRAQNPGTNNRPLRVTLINLHTSGDSTLDLLAGNDAKLRLQAKAYQANPVTFSFTTTDFSDILYLQVENDGTGTSVLDPWTMSKEGRVGMGLGYLVSPPSGGRLQVKGMGTEPAIKVFPDTGVVALLTDDGDIDCQKGTVYGRGRDGTSNPGVQGTAGDTGAAPGVHGIGNANSGSYGVYGQGTGDSAVYGIGTGVRGGEFVSTSNVGAQGTSTSNSGLLGWSTNSLTPQEMCTSTMILGNRARTMGLDGCRSF
jgi:hypothetical protein